MKHFLSKVKQSCKQFITGKSGFSLVELIVVIAIMAVMAAVLAPALLGYVEKSRMQKDSSAMREVTNAIHLSLADMDIYDEILVGSAKDNYSCYTDGDTSTNTDANKIFTKEPNYWLYNDNCRLLDETTYRPAGMMRGVTITFKPNGKYEYILKDGIINKMGDVSTQKGYYTGQTLAHKNYEALYNRLRSTIGDTLKVSSQTYRNSDYTIFISIGTTGGNQADKQDAIQVYGQYNGTNLDKVSLPIGSGAQDGNLANDSSSSIDQLNLQGLIPVGGTYYITPTGTAPGDFTGAVDVLIGDGESVCFPEIKKGDAFVYKNYEYRYKMKYDQGGHWRDQTYSYGWGVKVVDTTSTRYEQMLNTICDINVTWLNRTFENCTNMKIAPQLPEYSKELIGTFMGCTNLESAPIIPSNVRSLQAMFSGCSNLKTYIGSKALDGDFSNYIIPSNVISINGTFGNCDSMVIAPKLNEGLQYMYAAFARCDNLTTAPTIPSTITNLSCTFLWCPKLEGNIVINTNQVQIQPGETDNYNCYACFKGNDMTKIKLSGNASTNTLNIIGSTGNGWINIK